MGQPETKTVVIEFTRPTVFLLPRHPSAVKAEADGFRLFFGENTLTESYWLAVKKNPGVKIAIGAEYIKKLRDGVGAERVESIDALSDTRVAQVIEKIETLDGVRKIEAASKKRTVKAACSERAKKIIEQNMKD